jgi:O-antigen ligase
VTLLGTAWVGVTGLVLDFEHRGLRSSRVQLWTDVLRIAPGFLPLGAGLNSFGMLYPFHQTLWRGEWYGEAHNEYLQALIDLGLPGALITLALVVTLLRSALRAAPRSALDAGLLGSVIASCSHALVDFNWQIPANAATFVALAGLVMGGGTERGSDLTSTGPRA